ncbi:MAG: hypothetical protein PF505_11950 [Vallitaleaceae bacterium]|nr:hypothetical protein [Vallitaleaceae bacterium]
MKKGDKIKVVGPFGWFKIQDGVSPIVMYAGGVGITPIRALLKSLEANTSRPIEVVFASDDYYLFGEDLEMLAGKNPQMILHKTRNRTETEKIIDELAKAYGNKAYYYNSGSSKAIKAIKVRLKSKAINKKRMIDDMFFGY